MTRDTEQEVKPCKFVNGACIHCEATERLGCEGWICPPKRPWVDLTDEEIVEYLGHEYHISTKKTLYFFKLGLQAAKEKNT